MKKLMTMLAAAAMAFGLYADDVEAPLTESFEGSFTVDGATWKTNAADTATVEVQEYADGAAPTEILPDAFAAGAGTKYLQVKTGMKLDGTNGLDFNYGTEGASFETTDFFFDGLVDFTTVCGETNVDVTVTENECNVKLVAYAVDMAEATEDDTKNTTNLFITAGFWNGTKWEAKAYDCGNLRLYGVDGEDSGFTRLTIRAIGNISSAGPVPGFVVFVNGTPARRVNADAGIGYTGLNPIAAAWNAKRNLFPSLNQDDASGTWQTFAGVTVAGQGLIDCFALTRTSPDCAKDTNFTLEKDEHISSFKYKVDGGAESDLIEGDVSIPLTDEAMTVTITEINYVQALGQYETWGEGVWTGDAYVEANASAKTFTISAKAKNCRGKMVSKDVAERIEMGGVYYQTFAQAIAVIGASTAPVTLTINKNVNVEADAEFSSVVFPATSDVTIDLNGKTITGTPFTGYVLTSAGKLTIIDSDDGKNGTIALGTGNTGVVAISAGGMLTTEAGIYNGNVLVNTGANAVIKGGKFDKATNGVTTFALAEYVPATSKFEPVDDYFVVTPLTIWTVTFKKDAADTEAFATTNVVDGEALTRSLIPEPTKANYTFAGWKYTAGTPINADTTIVANWTANTYNITIANGGEGASATPATYTYNVATDVTLDAGTSNGYTFASWTASAGSISENTLTISAGTSGDITVTANWTATQYTITAVSGTVGGQTSYTYDIEDFEEGEALGLELAADEPVSGKTFKEWTITPATTGVSIDDPTSADAAILTIANGTLANFTVTATYEDEQSDPIPVPGPGETVTDALKKAGVPEGNPVLETVTEPSELTRLNGIITAAGGFSSDADVKAAQLANLNDTYILADITGGALLEAPAVIKVEKIESTTTAGTYAFEVTVKSNGESILAADCAEALKGKVFVSNALTGETDPFAPVEAKNIAKVTIAGGKATFEVSYGDGAQGFLKIKAVKPVINSQD